MEIKSYNKKTYLYVNTDNGTQYLDKAQAPNKQKLDEIPDNVAEFTFAIKTISAATSALGTDASIRYALNTRLDEPANAQERQERAAQKQKQDNEMLPQTEVEFSIIAEALVDWNLTKDDITVPITAQTLKQLEPAWLFDYIKDAYAELNEIDRTTRRD